MARLLSYTEQPVSLRPPATLTTTTTSRILDTQGYDVQALEVHLGADSGLSGSNTVTPTLQHSDTTADADFAAVSAGSIVGGFTVVDSASEDEVIQRAEYTGTKRYLRVLLTVAGTVSIPVSVRGCLAAPLADFVIPPSVGLAAT